MTACAYTGQAPLHPRPRAVVPIGGQAFVAPRVRPRDPSDELVRRASFAATRAHRHSWGSPALLSTSSPAAATNGCAAPHTQVHRRTASVRSAPAPLRRLSRRLSNFQLALPLEAQARFDAWQHSQLPATLSADAGDSAGGAEGSDPRSDSCSPESVDTPVHASILSVESSKQASTSTVDRDIPLRGRPAHAARTPSLSDVAPAALGESTPELLSSPSSPSDRQTGACTPCSARGEMLAPECRLGSTVCAGQDWVAKQDEYAERMYAFTGQMWGRERKHMERTAASGQKPSEPQTSRSQNEHARRAQAAQAQKARDDAAAAAAAAPQSSFSARFNSRGRSKRSTSDLGSSYGPAGSRSGLLRGDQDGASRWSRLLRRLFA